MKSKLQLKKETLTELTPNALRGVVGGAAGSDSCTSCVCSCVELSCMDPTSLGGVVTDAIHRQPGTAKTGTYLELAC